MAKRNRRGGRRQKEPDIMKGAEGVLKEFNEIFGHAERIVKSVERMATPARNSQYKRVIMEQIDLSVEDAEKILGVGIEEPIETITQVYREHLKVLQPDKNNDPDTKRQFLKINAAYVFIKRIKEEEKRKKKKSGLPYIEVVDKDDEKK